MSRTVLYFDRAQVRAHIGHALTARNHFAPYGGRAKPGLVLVHDQGVYLMSTGADDKPRGEHPRPAVAYARHCNPDKDAEFYDNGRDLVGGDDFAVVLNLAKVEEWEKTYGEKETVLRLGFGRSSIRFLPGEQGFTPKADASAPEKTETFFRAYAPRYDLSPEWYGKEFLYKGRAYVIAGINPRAPKKPVILISDGKQYKGGANWVKWCMRGFGQPAPADHA